MRILALLLTCLGLVGMHHMSAAAVEAHPASSTHLQMPAHAGFESDMGAMGMTALQDIHCTSQSAHLEDSCHEMTQMCVTTLGDQLNLPSLPSTPVACVARASMQIPRTAVARETRDPPNLFELSISRT